MNTNELLSVGHLLSEEEIQQLPELLFEAASKTSVLKDSIERVLLAPGGSMFSGGGNVKPSLLQAHLTEWGEIRPYYEQLARIASQILDTSDSAQFDWFLLKLRLTELESRMTAIETISRLSRRS